MDSLRVVEIVIDARSGGSEATYFYKDNNCAEIGQAYFVPLAGRLVLGYVFEIKSLSQDELGFSIHKLKSLGSPIEGLELSANMIQLINYIAQEYLCTKSEALTLAVPPSILNRIYSVWTLNKNQSSTQSLSVIQEEALKIIKELGGELVDSKKEIITPAILQALKELTKKGYLLKKMKLLFSPEKQQLKGALRLTLDNEKVEQFLQKEARKKPAQALAIMRLQNTHGSSFSPQEIRALSSCTNQTIKALLNAGLIEETKIIKQGSSLPPQLNEQQHRAVLKIQDKIKNFKHEIFLLYGITGSGKTEVYLQATAEALKQGRQILYLVPEITLTAQVIAQLRDRFGANVIVLHSNLTPQERLENWIRISRGEIPIVLGARSALFCPFTNLGLIILDEEHESSYKQETTPKYHSKNVAQYLSKLNDATLILGSATPSIETYYEAEQKQINLLSLTKRAVIEATLPAVYTADLKEVYKQNPPSIFTNVLKEKMQETLKRKEQVILFLNRRAYSPFLMCRDCGHIFSCPFCSVTLSYHRKDKKLKCHHCNHSIFTPDLCTECTGSKVNPFGIGVEKVEEIVIQDFPDANVARLDRDMTSKKGVLEETLAKFRSGDIDVLVGTQMIAKGLDFPKVTLVGVITADITLSLPDFRSSERTFQILSQVSGRAGRGNMPGQVVIQTFNPVHPAIVLSQQHDFLTFYDSIKQERQLTRYPPFMRLINIVFTGDALQNVVTATSTALELIQLVDKDVEILGPANCALERLNNKWRRHILLKLPPLSNPNWINHALQDFNPKNVSYSIDVDPYSLM